VEYNLVLRRLRYAFNINDKQITKVFALSGRKITPEEIEALLRKEEDELFTECDSDTLGQFLDGFIIFKRGPSDRAPAPSPAAGLTNNMILKKLRIALELKEDDMLATLKKGGADISKSELTAIFRKIGHKHYRSCGDQLLRQFINGITDKEEDSE